MTKLRIITLICVAMFGVCAMTELKPPYKFKEGYCTPVAENVPFTLAANIWNNLIFTQPKFVRFELYTRRNRNFPQRLTHWSTTTPFQKYHFNASWPVRLIVPGWIGRPHICSNLALKDAYLNVGDFNVINIDWSDYCMNFNYLEVIQQLPEIAEKINQLTRYINRYLNIKFSDMYLVGHSLSCHVISTAGKLLAPDKYGVLYALDPAGPVMNLMKRDSRLNPNDANYVEVVTTDMYVMGSKSPVLGHATFYVNWGYNQPNCPNATGFEMNIMCDHFQSLYYFVESIGNPTAFGSKRCRYKSILQRNCGSDCPNSTCEADIYMGGEPIYQKSGIYYLTTRKEQPYGNGHSFPVKAPLPFSLL